LSHQKTQEHRAEAYESRFIEIASSVRLGPVA
jgi:hypothetical protein